MIGERKKLKPSVGWEDLLVRLHSSDLWDYFARAPGLHKTATGVGMDGTTPQNSLLNYAYLLTST